MGVGAFAAAAAAAAAARARYAADPQQQLAGAAGAAAAHGMRSAGSTCAFNAAAQQQQQPYASAQAAEWQGVAQQQLYGDVAPQNAGGFPPMPLAARSPSRAPTGKPPMSPRYAPEHTGAVRSWCPSSTCCCVHTSNVGCWCNSQYCIRARVVCWSKHARTCLPACLQGKPQRVCRGNGPRWQRSSCSSCCGWSVDRWCWQLLHAPRRPIGDRQWQCRCGCRGNVQIQLRTCARHNGGDWRMALHMAESPESRLAGQRNPELLWAPESCVMMR